MRVGFDLDGVLYDFGDSVVRYLESIGRSYTHKDEADEPHSWDFYEHWGMDRNEFTQHCHDGADAGFIFCGGTRPGAVEAVWKVKDMGHEIIVITDRQFGTTPSVSHKNTINWWNDNGFPPYDELHFSADKTSAPTDIFVEDKLENYVALHQAGTMCWLITRPWNMHDPDRVMWRLDDISQYPDVVEVEEFVIGDFDAPSAPSQFMLN